MYYFYKTKDLKFCFCKLSWAFHFETVSAEYFRALWILIYSQSELKSMQSGWKSNFFHPSPFYSLLYVVNSFIYPTAMHLSDQLYFFSNMKISKNFAVGRKGTTPPKVWSNFIVCYIILKVLIVEQKWYCLEVYKSTLSTGQMARD